MPKETSPGKGIKVMDEAPVSLGCVGSVYAHKLVFAAA